MRDLILWITVLVLFGLIGAPTLAQEASEDEKAIDMLAPKWEQAWNSGDMKAVADLYTADSDYVAFTGETFQGREAIEETFAELSATAFKGTKISIQMTATRFIKPDLAVSESAWEFTGVPETEGEAPPTKGTSTVVTVKKDGQWLIAAHRSRILAAPPGTEP